MRLFQTSDSLPKTSYFKLIDIWLFFAIVAIFIVTAFQTWAEYYSYGDLLTPPKESQVKFLHVSVLVLISHVLLH